MNRIIKLAAAPVLIASISLSAGAQTDNNTTNDVDNTGSSYQPAVRIDYAFPHAETPQYIRPYSATVFSAGKRTVSTMRGDKILQIKDTITDFALNPIATNYAVITRKKSGETALAVYSAKDNDYRIHKFDVKKYGQPTAVAYTPEARRIAVATPGKILIFDTRKFHLENRIDLIPFNPESMVISSNGYYLALSDGKQVAVYNLEERTLRKRWDFDVKVTEVDFSNDCQQMGVLTDDGLLTIYDTRQFEMKTSVDNLGDGIAFAFNDNGKYVAVATSPDTIEIVNLLKHFDRESITVDGGNLADLCFLKDADNNTVLAYSGLWKLHAKRLMNLEPYYARLVNDEVDALMTEWMKMRPGESMDEYSARISDENQKRQRRLFEDEISTRFAGDMLSMSSITLGKYNSDKELLEIGFSNMPTIYLPVSRGDITAFRTADDIEISDTQYGLLPDDSFEMIYAKFLNKNDGKTYVYDNKDRVSMTFLGNDDNIVSLEVLQQQQMEEMKLQEIKEKVLREARNQNVISNHTHITVNSQVVPAYNANGEKILNYVVKFTYEVEPEFSAAEDFAPGKYKASESGAASSMLSIVRQAFEGELAQHIDKAKKISVNISGTADATPIIRGIPYDGCYGDFHDEPIRQNGDLTGMTVTKAGGIKTNEQLAFLRAVGVKDNLENNVSTIKDKNVDYRYDISVSQGKGSEFRRITAEFTIHDVF